MSDLVTEVADSIRASVDSEILARRAIRATIQHLIEQVDLLGSVADPGIPADSWMASLHHVRAMLVAELDDVVGEGSTSTPLW